MSPYIMSRSATAEPFHCARCNQPKKAKAKATRGAETICNGCYGNILSRGEQ